MSRTLGEWIHTFAITETSTHKDGYTVYKITSIVFPRSVPEALTCVTVWKRFHEVKRLYRELSRRQKALQLHSHVPEIRDNSFFKRFDPEVVQMRKNYILQLLDYAAQHPALYKSHPFLSFFENGHTPNVSPSHQKGNIETICDNLDLNVDSEISLIDPSKDECKEPLISSFVPAPKKNEAPCGADTKNKAQTEKDLAKILTPQISFEGDESDYIYEAAYEFSKAVQAEVNQEYEESYERYKSGVEKLLQGSRDDTNEERRFIAKAKVSKYVTRAEDIYEKFLMNKEHKKPTLQLSIDSTDLSTDEYLERPWNQLSKFKVMRIIDSVMQVQDVTDKSVYIMKAIEKPSTNSNAQSIFLPQGVPYMVRLLGFFQSDTAIYLLLEQAKGGKLFDYVHSYTPTPIRIPLNELFSEIDSDSDEDSKTPETGSINSTSNFDSGFVEMCSDYKAGIVELSKGSPESQDVVLSKDMDVNELVSCSQKLLKCVSDTLEQSKKNDISNKDIFVKKEKEDLKDCKEQKKDTKLDGAVGVEPKNGRLPEVSVKQWAKELVSAIESLHLKGVILGDLHPENLLLGSKGQLLLSYFHQNEGSGSSLQLLVSIVAMEGMYVAPERPLTVKSDCWSFGVILFELLTGYTFRSCHPAGLAAYFAVQYPDISLSTQAKDLLDSVLQYNPEHRYGIEQIKGHAFFIGTNWDDIGKNGVNSH